MRNLAFVLLLSVIIPSFAAAQRHSVSVNGNIKSVAGGPGVGPGVRYAYQLGHFRLAPEILTVCSVGKGEHESSRSIAMNTNLHFIFFPNRRFNIYPLFGLTVCKEDYEVMITDYDPYTGATPLKKTKDSERSTGFNMGFGVGLNRNEIWAFYLEIKGMSKPTFGPNDYLGEQITLGIACRF